MKNLLTFLLFVLTTIATFAQSPMASVNGSMALLTTEVPALEDAVISLEIYPNTEDWEWNGPNGYMGSGAAILLSEFTQEMAGSYIASNTADSLIADVTFSLIYLEDNFAGQDSTFLICSEDSLTIGTSVVGFLNLWSTGETTSSIDVSGEIDSTYTLTLSTIFGDSDTVDLTINHTEMPSVSYAVSHAVSCAQEGQVNISLQDISTEDLPILASVYKDNILYSYIQFTDIMAVVELPAGIYTSLEFESFNNCNFSFDGFVIESFTGVREELTMGTIVICNGESVTLNALGGYAEYIWNTGDQSGSIEVSPEVTGEFTVDMYDSNGCGVRVHYPVVVSDNPIAMHDFVENAPFGGGYLTIDLLNAVPSMFPINAFAYDNGVEVQIATIIASNRTVFTEASYYEDLRLVTAQGCETYLGSFGSLNSGVGIVEMDVNYYCMGEDFTLTGPAGFDSFSWSDGSADVTYSSRATRDEEVVLYAVDFNGNISQFVYPIELLDSPEGQFQVNDRIGIVLGSVDILLTEFTTDMFPISVYVTPLGGFGETEVDLMYSSTSTIQLGDGEYADLRIESAEGCSYYLGSFVITEGVTYSEIIIPDLEVCVGNFATLTPPSNINNTHLWNDGVTSRTRTVLVSETMTMNVESTDFQGNITNYIFPLISRAITEANFTINSRVSNVLGSIDVELVNMMSDMYPADVYVTDMSSGTEMFLTEMSSPTANIQLSDGSYSNLRIQNASGCNTVLGDFDILFDNGTSNNRIAGKVWLDTNSATGILEDDESRLEGVIVRAINIEGDVKGETISDADGTYALDLDSESVYLEFDPVYNLTQTLPNMGDGNEVDSDLDGSNGPGTTEFILPGEDTDGVNAGFVFGVLSLSWNGVSVAQEGDGHKVTWNVRGEEYISHYIIQSSTDGISNFETIATIDPLQNSEPSNNYNYVNFHNLVSGTHYYRVQHLDTDGRSTYSEIVSIDVNDTDIAHREPIINLFPIPSSDIINIEIDKIDTNENIEMSIYNIEGKLVMSKSFNKIDDNIFQVDISTLNSNLYFMNLTIGKQLITKRISVKR